MGQLSRLNCIEVMGVWGDAQECVCYTESKGCYHACCYVFSCYTSCCVKAPGYVPTWEGTTKDKEACMKKCCNDLGSQIFVYEQTTVAACANIHYE